MSALEKALRQIEQDRQARKVGGTLRGVMPGIMLDGEGKPKQSRRGLFLAVVVLSVAFAGTWLMMLGLLPVGLEDLSRWGKSMPSVSALFSRPQKVATQESGSTEPVASDAAPVSSPAAPQSLAAATSLPITVAASASAPAQAQVAAPNAALPPAGMVKPGTPPTPSAPPQTSPQAALPAQPVLPPKPSIPAPAATPVLATAPALAPAPKPVVVVPNAPATSAAPAPLAAPKPAVVAVAAPPAAPPAAPKPAVSALAPAAAPAAPKPVAATPPAPTPVVMGPAPSKSAEEETDAAPKPVTTSKADAEPPQLSRTDADRLSTTGQASPAAKAIDVDYQMIERSLARGDHQTALESAGKLEKYIGENWRTRYLTGVALMGLNRWEPAIVALSKAQDLNPSHAMSALYLSVALQERGEHTRAIQVLDKALVSLPQSSELWLNLGHSHEALGHKAEAKTAYNRFLDLSGNRQDLAGQRVWVQNRLQKDK